MASEICLIAKIFVNTFKHKCFSTMNRIKTPMRSCLADERTSDLVVLGHEKDLTKGVNLSSVLDIFAKERRRIQL